MLLEVLRVCFGFLFPLWAAPCGFLIGFLFVSRFSCSCVYSLCIMLFVGFEFKSLGPCGVDWVSFCGLVWLFMCILLVYLGKPYTF
jgi:hypothetical protein